MWEFTTMDLKSSDRKRDVENRAQHRPEDRKRREDISSPYKLMLPCSLRRRNAEALSSRMNFWNMCLLSIKFLLWANYELVILKNVLKFSAAQTPWRESVPGRTNGYSIAELLLVFGIIAGVLVGVWAIYVMLGDEVDAQAVVTEIGMLRQAATDYKKAGNGAYNPADFPADGGHHCSETLFGKQRGWPSTDEVVLERRLR